MTTLTQDVTWVLLASFLVALMQAGFTCVEAGMVRLKNSINVAIKNLIDFCLSSALFTLIGYSIMFGDSTNGWIGPFAIADLDQADPETTTFFIFELMFCGTAATIISGAVSERMRFSGYIVVTLLAAGLIYPVVGHWIWNGLDVGQATGWLGEMGFLDFAGSTVVHSVGGWIALAAIIVIGPRIGRFGPGGRQIEGHNLPIAVLGVFLLWFGFFGFNGGSTLVLDSRVPHIVVNTSIAGAMGGIGAMAMSWKLTGFPEVDRIISGVIAGMVAICASVDLVTVIDSAIIGCVAGVLTVLSLLLLEMLEIDDAIGAVPSHLVAGIWGTLAVGIFPPADVLTGGSRLVQFGIQSVGVVSVGASIFIFSYVAFRLINMVIPLRVTADEERKGLNISEHGATSALLDLVGQLNQQARTGNFGMAVQVEEHSEASEIATFYNAVRERFNRETERRKMALEELERQAYTDPLTGLSNRRHFVELLDQTLSKAANENADGAVFYFDLDGFKAVNDQLGHDAGDELLLHVAQRLETVIADRGILARLGGDEFSALLPGPFASNELPETVAREMLKAISRPFELKGGDALVGLSIGIARFGPSGIAKSSAAVLTAADRAMYAAKRSGKGTYRMAEDATVNRT
ncbi:ammonium transporter [Rhodospirillaceae bacterium KN72]|uniref:Ammonium transporter n=1 Tax=Pacificispira spongiicola TaxID=2729598 RepID=A0A7Y0E0A1_9PROT|nr:ammonium transporter [Pacificispira spongiicola]NMM44101.1 ammonium transporter [Pacificispira spongiicola]